MDYVERIVERIKKIHPQKIILFGSRAGTPGSSDSDVDVLVVTSDDYMPDDFAAINRIYLEVSNLLTDIEREVPVDLIVHTRPMHKKFIEMGSSFAKTIQSQGVVVYEKNR